MKSSLPFSWEAFFYSSLFFTIANIIRISFCPKIINEHSDYASFKRSEMTSSHLIEYESEFENGMIVFARNKHFTERKGNISESELSKVFWDIHKKANDANKMIQYITALLYIFGFLLISIVVLQNVKNVLAFW